MLFLSRRRGRERKTDHWHLFFRKSHEYFKANHPCLSSSFRLLRFPSLDFQSDDGTRVCERERAAHLSISRDLYFLVEEEWGVSPSIQFVADQKRWTEVGTPSHVIWCSFSSSFICIEWFPLWKLQHPLMSTSDHVTRSTNIRNTQKNNNKIKEQTKKEKSRW